MSSSSYRVAIIIIIIIAIIISAVTFSALGFTLLLHFTLLIFKMQSVSCNLEPGTRLQVDYLLTIGQTRTSSRQTNACYCTNVVRESQGAQRLIIRYLSPFDWTSISKTKN
jgi:hypothetical protein